MTADLFDLSGRVAVVTGGSRGLGKEMCLAFATQGASVVVASRKADVCDAVANEITTQTGQKALGVGCHVGNWADCNRLVETVYDRFGRIDVLVNNAGMAPVYSSLVEVTEELFDKVVAVNLRGPFRLAALVGTRMAEAGAGSIINVSTVAAVQPTPSEVPYAAAKAGLNALTVGLSRSFGPNVRVNGIMPGPFLTDIANAWNLEAFNRFAKRRMPLGRAGEAHEIVGAALYFASDASAFTTGAILKVDGGYAYAPA